jgi:hypothetical protein
MTDQSNAVDRFVNSIDSTLVFDTDQRFTGHGDPRTLIAEGIHQRGKRSIRTQFILVRGKTLKVRRYYRYEQQLRAQDSGSEWTVCDGTVAYSDQELHEFIKDNFYADPEASMQEEFESMVDLDGVDA